MRMVHCVKLGRDAEALAGGSDHRRHLDDVGSRAQNVDEAHAALLERVDAVGELE